MFFPWRHKQPPKLSAESWEEFVLANQDDLCPRLKRYIYNLGLLHQSAEDTKIHQMQLRARARGPVRDADDFDDNSTVVSHDSFDDFDDDLDEPADDFSADVEDAINNPIEQGLDFYSREGLDACRDNGYLNTASSPSSQSIPDESISSVFLSLIFKSR